MRVVAARIPAARTLTTLRAMIPETSVMLLAVVFLVSPALAAEPASPNHWPLYRGDSLGTGVAQAELPEKPELLWKYEVKGGAFEGSAAIVGGVVYLGDLDGRLLALDLKTGKLNWERKRETGYMASPAVRDGRLFLGDLDGGFHCFEAKSGELVWSFATEAEIDSSANFYRDRVLVGSQDATLYCLTADKGELVWKFQIGDQIRCSPTIVENRCFVAGCDSKLHVIDLDQGTEVATVEIGAPTGVTPAVRGDLAYFGTEGGMFFAVNWRKAEVGWTFQPESGGQPYRSSPAINSSVVVFGGRNRRVHALDPLSGKTVWEMATKNRVDGSPVIVGERVFVGAADGRLYAIDIRKGEVVWEYQGSGGFNGSAAVAENRLVVATDKGLVYCFGRP